MPDLRAKELVKIFTRRDNLTLISDKIRWKIFSSEGLERGVYGYSFYLRDISFWKNSDGIGEEDENIGLQNQNYRKSFFRQELKIRIEFDIRGFINSATINRSLNWRVAGKK